MAEDPKGLVYSGRDNSGAAFVLPDRDTFLKPMVDAQVVAGRKSGRDAQLDMQLRGLTADMGKVWDVDIPEMEIEYEKIVEKMKDYETTTDKKDKREKKYDLTAAVGRFKNLVHKSQQTQRQFVAKANDISKDQIGSYDETAQGELEKFAQTPLAKRPDTPAIKKYAKVDAMDWMVKNVEYEPQTKGGGFTREDGTYERGTKTYVDEAKLKAAIAARIPTMPQNLRNILGHSAMDKFIAQNHTAIYDPPDVREQKFQEFVVNEVYDAKIHGMKLVDKHVVSYKKTDGGGLNLNFGGGRAETKKAIYTVQKVDEEGTYRINIQDRGTASPADNKPINWAISGAEFKKLPGVKNTEGIQDDDEMIVKGTLSFIEVNEDKKREPQIGIVFEEVIGGGSTISSGGGDLSIAYGLKEKRGHVLKFEYNYDNKAKILEYGADPVKDIFPGKRKEADEEYETRNKKKPKSPSSGVKTKVPPHPSTTTRSGRNTY